MLLHTQPGKDEQVQNREEADELPAYTTQHNRDQARCNGPSWLHLLR